MIYKTILSFLFVKDMFLSSQMAWFMTTLTMAFGANMTAEKTSSNVQMTQMTVSLQEYPPEV